LDPLKSGKDWDICVSKINRHGRNQKALEKRIRWMMKGKKAFGEESQTDKWPPISNPEDSDSDKKQNKKIVESSGSSLDDFTSESSESDDEDDFTATA
jgi:hypothetical protein